MKDTDMNTTITELVTAARRAFAESDAHHDVELETGRRIEVDRIREQLAKHGIQPCDEPFTNWVSNRVCVPLIPTSWDEERETQIHAVAAEWDYDSRELGLVLVADGDADADDWHARRLYPAGRLTELADIGRAIERGGRSAIAPPTVGDRVRKALMSVTVDYAGPNAPAILAAADAVCEALMDIADAIRETRAAV